MAKQYIYNEINTKIKKKYGILYFIANTKTNGNIYENNVYYEKNEINKIVNFVNENTVFVIIGETCIIFPKLALYKWNYFEKLLNSYNSDLDSVNKSYIIDITNLVYDSKIIYNVDYSSFHKTLICFILGGNFKYMDEPEKNHWKLFLELLIPYNEIKE